MTFYKNKKRNYFHCGLQWLTDLPRTFRRSLVKQSLFLESRSDSEISWEASCCRKMTMGMWVRVSKKSFKWSHGWIFTKTRWWTSRPPRSERFGPLQAVQNRYQHVSWLIQWRVFNVTRLHWQIIQFWDLLNEEQLLFTLLVNSALKTPH